MAEQTRSAIPIDISNLIESIKSINEGLRKEDSATPYIPFSSKITDVQIVEKMNLCAMVKKSLNNLQNSTDSSDTASLEEISIKLRSVVQYRNFYNSVLSKRAAFEKNSEQVKKNEPTPAIDPSSEEGAVDFRAALPEMPDGEAHIVSPSDPLATDRAAIDTATTGEPVKKDPVPVRVEVDNKTDVSIAQIESEEEDIEVEEADTPEVDEDSILHDEEKTESDDALKVEIEKETDEDQEKAKYIIEEYKKTNLQNVRNTSRQGTDKVLKLMQRLNVDLPNLELLDIEAIQDQNFQKTYINSANSMLATPRVTRSIHPFSGFYSEIGAYNEFDLVSINRDISNETDYVRQQTLIYTSIFDHIRYTSFKAKPTFDEWATALLLPDLNSLFFALYDANYPGINPYEATCNRCGADLNLKVHNDDLACHINKGFTDDYVKELLYVKDRKKLTNIFSEKYDNKVDRHKLPVTGIVVEFELPTLSTYLKTIDAISSLISSNNIYNINVADIDDPRSPAYNLLRILLYVKRIALPVPKYPDEKAPPEEQVVKVKYIAMKDRVQTIGILMQLNRQDYRELFRVKEVKELAGLRGIDYYIKDVQCENPDCKATLFPLYIDPKRVFFSRLGEETDDMTLTPQRRREE
jgi:hypothetical protein